RRRPTRVAEGMHVVGAQGIDADYDDVAVRARNSRGRCGCASAPQKYASDDKYREQYESGDCRNAER
ncbi:hypothetical protein L0P50_18555, partial [Lawsonibacter sp. DFI.6.74]|nr:hypothetical protein [Lawsonibacter sp. DFI.6.74]